MNNTFVEEIRNAVAEALEGKIVEAMEVEKANGVMYTGLSIRTEGCNIAPTIYLDEDMSVEMNVKRVLDTYAQYQPKGSLNMEWFADYEQVKDKLAIMLTSKPISGLAKRKAPGFDDLYMHAYVQISNSEIGMGNIKITQEHLKHWGITNAKLFADALKSAPTVAPANLRSMFETLEDMGAPVPTELAMNDPMSVLTNKNNVMGAAAILYTKVKENTYMVPSSIHEVILLDGDAMPPVALNGIINEVNSTVLAPQDFLSNHAYRFDGKKWENVA